MIDLPQWVQTLQNARVIDLTQTLEEIMPHYPTHSKFYHTLWNSYWHGDRSLTYQLIVNEHNGTHVDAPAHFISDAKPEAHVTIDRVPLTRLCGRGVHLNCRQFRAGENVSRAFVTAWESSHGALQAGDIVLFDFGWADYWALRPRSERYLTNWPGVGLDTAEYLIGKAVAALGVDTLSPDNPQALAGHPIHPIVLEKQVLIVENLCRLGELPDFFLFLALPLKIRDGSGSPVRAIGLV